jgi:hypothetical protein
LTFCIILGLKNMKYLIFLFLLFSSLFVYSQSNYTSGYYVTKSGDTIRGYIQNQDWLVSPSKFNFRKSENGNEIEISLNEATMFALSNNEIYIAKKFYYSELPEIVFYKKEEMNKYDSLLTNSFVRVLVKGKLSLFRFISETTGSYYLISSGDKEELLIYRKYRIYSDSTGTGAIYEVENKQYQRQLKKIMADRQKLFSKIDVLEYADKQLIKIVSRYNESSGGASQTLTNRSDKVKIYIRPAIAASVLPTKNIKSVFVGAIGVDFVVPRNFERLVIYGDAEYRSFTATTFFTDLFGVNTYSTSNINSVVFSAGIRQYLLKKGNRPYIYAGGHLWYSDKDDVRNYFTGAGFSYNKRFEIDVSYNNRLSNSDANNKYYFILLKLSYRIAVKNYYSSN